MQCTNAFGFCQFFSFELLSDSFLLIKDNKITWIKAFTPLCYFYPKKKQKTGTYTNSSTDNESHYRIIHPHCKLIEYCTLIFTCSNNTQTAESPNRIVKVFQVNSNTYCWPRPKAPSLISSYSQIILTWSVTWIDLKMLSDLVSNDERVFVKIKETYFQIAELINWIYIRHPVLVILMIPLTQFNKHLILLPIFVCFCV